ncbi:MAG TPA: hypothetical protein VHO47_00095 [Candidatus Babeliales bacterium]|nr:hypothetical protein [Candidatus Babeliales bacterium]
MKKKLLIIVFACRLNIVNGMQNNTPRTNLQELAAKGDVDALFKLSIEQCKNGSYGTTLASRYLFIIRHEQDLASCENPVSYGEIEEFLIEESKGKEWLQEVGEKCEKGYRDYLARLGSDKINAVALSQIKKIKKMQLPEPRWKFLKLKNKTEYEKIRNDILEQREKKHQPKEKKINEIK